MIEKNTHLKKLDAASSKDEMSRIPVFKASAGFCERSMSEETRRAYRRVVREFFNFMNDRTPGEITPDDVRLWRDDLAGRKKPSTVAFKLSVIRSLFEYLKLGGYVSQNPAAAKLVPPPQISEELRGRALTAKEVRYLLSGPDRAKAIGARDYAILLLMVKTSLRVTEACTLRISQIKWNHGRWVVKFRVKGGRERTLPLPQEVKKAIDDYIKLDRKRRELQRSDGPEAFIFQPLTNYRTLVFAKPLTATMVWNIVKKWGEFTGLGHLSPHDLRRTAITRALDQGLSYRQVQMMSGHKDPKTVMRYDHGRENLDQNAVNFINYGEE